jgi:hypothetical protein
VGPMGKQQVITNGSREDKRRNGGPLFEDRVTFATVLFVAIYRDMKIKTTDRHSLLKQTSSRGSMHPSVRRFFGEADVKEM